jgi:glycosyltransferase involved in cell wall biosynthesis
LRVLHLVNHTHRLNGNAHAVVDIACAQADLGHDVAVLHRGGSFDDAFRAHNVKLYQQTGFGSAKALLRNLREIDTVLHAFRPDVVHGHMIGSVLSAWPVTRLRRKPLVATVHNAFESTAVLMGLADRVVGVSRTVSESMIRRGVDARKLRTILNGTIGTARLPAALPDPVPLQRPAVLFVGGLHFRKGVPDLLKGVALARRTRPDLHLYLVGEGPEGAAYAAGITDEDRAHIHFEGAASDPRGYMQAADVFVLASIADPAPLVISEAREAGLGIIATAVDGIPELLEDGRAGRLIRPNAPEELAEALLQVFDTPEALAELRNKSQENIDHMSVRRVAQQYIDLYSEAAPR